MNAQLKRCETFELMANMLSALTDKEIAVLFANSTHLSNSIGGSSAVVNMNKTPIFIKKIRLTELELLPENQHSTANLFDLPLYYQYGVGSTGFGAWRELAAHQLTTNWVLKGDCLNFPCLYHWRIMNTEKPVINEAQLQTLNKEVAYWNHSPAIRARLKANLNASAHIILFLEYVPYNLFQWCGEKIHQQQGDTACAMILPQLMQTITFMQSQQFIHFDAHFHNILTDGQQLYFGDFGLASTMQFALSEQEQAFFKRHINYDYYSAITNLLHCMITHHKESDNWIETMREMLHAPSSAFVPLQPIISQYAPIAVIMDNFYRGLQKNKTTAYPFKALQEAWPFQA